MKLKTIILTGLLSAGLAWNAAASDKPNIVIFFADDLGWADLGYRNKDFNTPNINQLKKDGLEFTRAYVTTPTCSPSRASLLTGKEPIRFAMPRHVTNEDPKNTTDEFNLWPNDPVQMPSRNWLPLEETTYAECLKELGYYNAFIGKWHLGGEAFYPSRQGFDEAIGECPHGHPQNYYPPYWKENNPFPEYQREYLTDVLTDKAVDFIRDYERDEPFELSLFHFGVHGPQIGRKDLIRHYKDLGWEDRYAEYGAMVTALDESLGRIRKALTEKGIADNTILIFTSDQGGFFSNYPLRGAKTGGNTLGEGGARVPFILYYPGKTKAGAECSVPIQTLDVFPTLQEIASGKPCSDTTIQGKSLMPLIHGEEFPERNLYFFRSYENQYAAIMNGDWKLIKYHQGPSQLYNIRDDIGEAGDLIFVNPEKAELLQTELEEWEKTAVPKF